MKKHKKGILVGKLNNKADKDNPLWTVHSLLPVGGFFAEKEGCDRRLVNFQFTQIDRWSFVLAGMIYTFTIPKIMGSLNWCN